MSTEALGAVTPRSVVDDVTDRIRRAIVLQQFAPGQKLREDELAERLGVSRGPVRDALTTLAAEGLVERVARRYTAVAQLSGKDLEEVYSLRQSVERLAVEWACRAARTEDLDAMDAIVAAFGALPAKRVTPAVAADYDIQFHDALCQAAHHDRLAGVWKGLRSQIYMFLLSRNALPSDYLGDWQANHARIAALVRARDARAAVDFVERHIEMAYEALVDARVADGIDPSST